MSSKIKTDKTVLSQHNLGQRGDGSQACHELHLGIRFMGVAKKREMNDERSACRAEEREERRCDLLNNSLELSVPPSRTKIRSVDDAISTMTAILLSLSIKIAANRTLEAPAHTYMERKDCPVPM